MQSSADARREYYRGQRGRRTASQEENRSYESNDYHIQNQSCDGESHFYHQNEGSFAHQSPQSQSQFQLREDGINGDIDDEEDYSISVSAIMQRRASVRGYRGKRGSRNSRRASSPMDHVLDSVERRRSSVYTTSSEEGTNQESTQEQIFENIRLHKEVIQSVKLQPWPIRKKLKLVRQAKTYVARHEGALQERFAMSRSTRDLWARFKILMAARWRHWKRETASFLTVLIPWELRIKEIESHFGSGVASYFTFLRWLMWVNIMIAIPLVAFVIGPEYFATKHDETDPRKRMSEPESKVAGNLFTFWEFEGYLKYSPMFYGYYSSTSGISTSGYKLPLAYFLTAVLVYVYSFVATLRKMAENSRNSKLSSKDDECVFSWKLFTGWDFMIGHAETAHNRIASVVVGFKEALLEEAEKKKDNRNWRVILQRILVNILVLVLLGLSGATVVLLVNHSEELAKHDNWISRNAVNVTMTLLSFFLPMIFEALGLFENWHPRQQLRLQLARIMILNMLNLYSLMFSFIYKINSKEKPLQMLKLENETNTMELQSLMSSIEALKQMTTTTPLYSDSTTDGLFDESISASSTASLWGGGGGDDGIFSTTTAAALLSTTMQRIKCYNMTVKCSKPRRIMISAKNITTALLLLNLTTTAMVPTPTTTTTTTMTTTPATTPTTTTTQTTTTTTTTTTQKPTTTKETTTQTTTATTLPITSPSPTTTSWLTTTTATTEEPTTTTITSTSEPNTTTTKKVTPTISTLNSTTSTTTTTAKPDDNFLTTNEDDDIYDYGSDEPTGSTPPSTTTTASPGNDSFFNYVDYFEGIALPEAGEDEVDYYEQTTTEETQDSLVKVLDELQVPKHRRKRADAADSPIYRTSKYSRRHRNDTAPPIHRPPPLYLAPPPVRPAWSTTHKPPSKPRILTKEEWERLYNRPLTKKPSTTPTTTSTSTTTTTRKPRRFVFRTTTEADISTTGDSTTDWSTSTKEDTTTTTGNDEAVDEERNENRDNEDHGEEEDEGDGTTPYFIDYRDISEIGGLSYDMDTENMGTCIITVCPKGTEDDFLFSGGSTTESGLGGSTQSSDSKQLTTIKLTPLERQMERLKEVHLAISRTRTNLTTMCWETSLGQELSKVIVFDGLMSIVAPLCIDFLRALFVRYVNQNWCWDMEKTFPQYGDFKIAENILTLINNQGQVWMGIFFSPGLVLINLVKLMIMMYFRSWIVLTCNVPHEVVFKASKSNNFYLSLLLTMLFLCVLPVGYAIVWLRPSWHCGPFSEYNRIAEFITNTTRNALPKQLHEPLDYLTSSSTVIPLLVLLILIIYYLVSLTGALREANQDLRTQLQKEREEERKKIFKVPEVKQAEPTATTLTNRWRKVLEASSPVTPTQPPDFDTEEYKNQARKELISRIMKKALRKGSATSDEDSFVRRDDDDTDTEHQDSLPHDEEAKDKRFGLSRLQQIRRTRKPSLVDIVQIAKQERARAGSIVQASGSASADAATAPTSTSGGGGGGNFPIKEPHPKSRFKVEKHERRNERGGSVKETKKDAGAGGSKWHGRQPPPYESPKEGAKEPNEHDPDTNSRIVSERRASLLRRRREQEQELQNDNENPNEEQTSSTQPTPETPTGSAVAAVETKAETLDESLPSKFQIVDERKPPSPSPPEGGTVDQSEKPAKESGSSGGGGLSKFKFRRSRIKSHHHPTNIVKPEPEVFKFDDKSLEKSKSSASVLADPAPTVVIPLAEGDAVEALSLPSPTPSFSQHQRQLANFSRQGRKKIGSLLALVREAVNLKKDDVEQGSDESPGPTTPTYLAYTPPPPPSVLSSNSSATALEMPPTPEPESPTPSAPLHFGSSSTSSSSSRPVVSKPPQHPNAASTPTLATLDDDLEELDMPGPITFPKRSASQRRRAMRQDSQSSIWSDNIPTITISTTGSDECIVEPPPAPEAPVINGRDSPPTPNVNIIKITIEDDQDDVNDDEKRKK
ncbi:transmembrane channel-like protein [Drosophila tropicalis]|uniref:transmembrane channel-like protein n=1 Tax=Drosophila tropicalis TaxID=46794 RepID=UPI0035ABFC0C